jgi:membrane protease YdiL (CAAX protease family)
MENLIVKNKLQATTWLILVELTVLLLLPLPFLKLNVLYVVSALIIMFLSKFMRKEKWSDYGFKTINLKMLLLAIAIGVVYGFADNFFIEQLITRLTGITPDLGSYQSVKGDAGRFIIMLAIGWFIGGLFEEMFFRGYLYNRFQSLIHNQKLYKFITILLTSIVFAFAHNYQGISGILDTGLFAVIMGLLYFVFGRNVWYLILIHGMYDTVGIVRLYMGY